MTVVIDTNVILVANRQHPDVSEACVRACARQLNEVMKSGCVAIDDGFRIIREYLNKTSPNGEKRAGNVFVKWLLQAKSTAGKCDQVRLVEHAERGFESFPDDARLASFDTPDRKFVAVAAAHAKKPPILQAADSKWLDCEPALRDHGIAVDFVCPTDIHVFDDNKKGRKGKRA